MHMLAADSARSTALSLLTAMSNKRSMRLQSIRPIRLLWPPDLQRGGGALNHAPQLECHP